MFLWGWLIMLGRDGSLSLQELCFQYVEAALFPNTVVSDVFLWLAHHVGKRWLSFIARAVLSVGRSRAIAKHSGFRCFCGLAHHVGKRWLSFIARAVLSLAGFRCFWLMMMGRGDFLSLQEPFVSWRPLPKGWGRFGGVSLIGGFVWGFGWGVRGVLRIVFLIPATLPGPVSVSIGPFFAI